MKDSEEMLEELFARREKYYIERRKKMRNAKRVISVMAGCLVVMFVVSIPVTNHFLSSEDDNSLLENNILNIEADYSPSIIKGMMPDNIDDLENLDGELQNEEIGISNETDVRLNEEVEAANTASETMTEGTSVDVPQEEYRDVPAPVNSGNTGALVPYEPVWGGSYPNEVGQWVILLTENTAENQKKVFELNPSLTESNTIFKTATYSLAYLKNLMESISQVIGSNGDMSFVSSVGLREEENCIQVIVTTDDSESIAKILAFDTLGGAIEIVNINNSVVPEGAQKGRMP